MANDPIGAYVRHLVAQRSCGVCERCGMEPATNYHHRRARGMGGTRRKIHTAEWLLHLCGTGTTGCHGYIEAHPQIAYLKGWKLRHHQWPATTPVQLRAGWVILLPDGEVMDATPYFEEV